ncbi:hypothetical protein AVEN_35845-1 [Araneus ventricosus]|uniref:Uncharacterized protein n=1 Tax=Araneus ventricosus TaxID=182803 RepID=A0A4Y2BJR4_ARAVE|nr:hypothetical protein AVEN_35845-1 [Araneus ventricosus]
MVSFDDVWSSIACPWLSPYHYPSGIVLDVKSRLIRKKYVAPLLGCPTAMFTGPMQPRSDVRWGQRHTNNRSSCGQSSFMQSARHSLGYGPCSSRELQRQLPRCYCPPTSGTWQQVAIVCRCGDSPASRPTSFTGVSIPLVIVSQPMDNTTMHIQLSGNNRLSCTGSKHTDSPPVHLIVQMVSSTHAFCFGSLRFHGIISACELKHRSGKPLF